MRVIAPIAPAGGFAVTKVQYIEDGNGVRLDTIINEQTSRIAAYKADIDNLKSGLATAQTNLAENNEKIATNKTDIANLKTGLATVQSSIVNKEEKILHFKTWADYEKAKNTIPVDTYFVIEEDAGEDVYKKIEQIEEDIAVQTARIDQLVGTVPPGSGDEVTDARVMVDGKTANNLGTAIRSQVTRLKEHLESVTTESKNIFDIDKLAWDSTSSGVTKYNVHGNSFTVKNDRVVTFSAVYFPFVFKPNTKYTISFDVTINKGYAYLARRTSTDGGQTYPEQVSTLIHIGTNSGHRTLTFTTDQNVYWRIFFFGSWNTASECDVTFSNVQIEESEYETAYFSHRIADDKVAREKIEDMKFVQAYNLIPKKYIRPQTIEQAGIKFVIDAEGCVTMNGIATARFSQALIASSNPYQMKLETDYYTLSGCNSEGKGYNTYVSIRQDGVTNLLRCYDSPVNYKYKAGLAEMNMGITIDEGTVLNDEKVCFMLERGRTAHDYVDPVIQPGNIAKAISNSQAYEPVNMIPPATTRTTNGIEFKVRNDGSITLNGTATDTTSFAIVAKSSESRIKLGRYYTISGCTDGSSNTYYIYCTVRTSSNIGYRQYNIPSTFYLDARDDMEYGQYWLGVSVVKGATLNNVEIKPMLETGLYHEAYVSPYSVTEATNTVPVLSGDAIAISEGARLARTEWSPISEIPKFEKGEIYSGIPYHANLHLAGRDVLVNRTLETFYSAVKNPASILYTGKYDDYDETGDPAYGSMCSSFTHWIYGQQMLRWTEELYNGYIETYEYNGPESVAVGDAMVMFRNGQGHVMSICGIDVDANTGTTMYFRIIDETHPTIRQRRLSVPQFEKQLETYKLGRYPETNIIDVKPLRYSTDIITEFGNNTYFKIDEDIWCYISTDSKAATIKNLKTGTETTVTPDETKIENGVTVYNISKYLTELAEYEVSTDPNIKNRCKLLRIKTAEFSFDDSTKTVTATGFSDNATPDWAYFYAKNKSTGYTDIRSKGVFENNTIDVSELYDGTYSEFYLKVYYKTKYGYAVENSEVHVI